jgi:hypothetical protein
MGLSFTIAAGPRQRIELVASNYPRYKISVRTAQKTPFLTVLVQLLLVKCLPS